MERKKKVDQADKQCATLLFKYDMIWLKINKSYFDQYVIYFPFLVLVRIKNIFILMGHIKNIQETIM